MLSNVANFMMDILFIFGLGWGVAGAALATSVSQYVGMAAMLFLLHRKRILNFADMLHIPSIGDVAPLLRVTPPLPCSPPMFILEFDTFPVSRDPGARYIHQHMIYFSLSCMFQHLLHRCCAISCPK